MKQIRTDVFPGEPLSCASPTVLSVFIRSIRGETRINKASQAIYEKRQSNSRFSQNVIFVQKSPDCGFNSQSGEGSPTRENHSLQMNGVLFGGYTSKHNTPECKRSANATNFIDSIKFMKFDLINSVEFVKFTRLHGKTSFTFLMSKMKRISTDALFEEAVFNSFVVRSRPRSQREKHNPSLISNR